MWFHPELKNFDGKFVCLKPMNAQRDGEVLFSLSHGTPEKESVWDFLYYGAFANSEEYKLFLQNEMQGQRDSLAWTVFSSETNQQIGVVALLAITAQHGRAEIGHVWFTPAVHKTKANTESQFLLLSYLFDSLKYRRVEWKCDASNHASRTAANRLGFTFEGRFRQHMFVKGRNRDTDWFAMTEKDWQRCKINFEKWLYTDEKLSLSRMNND